MSIDPVARSQALARSLGLAFPLLSDPDMTVIRAYGVADEANGIAWPAEILIDPGGGIRWRKQAQSVGTRPPVSEVLGAFDAAGGRGR